MNLNISKILDLSSKISQEISLESSISIKKGEHSWNLNGDISMPAASIAKLFVLGAATQALCENKLEENSLYHLKKSDYVGGAGIIKYMHCSISFKLIDLIYLMIKYSDNIAANIIINRLGFDYIQNFISLINAKNTNFVVPMMPKKSIHGTAPNTTTANDVLLLYQTLLGSNYVSISFVDESKKIIKIFKDKQNNWIYLFNNLKHVKYVLKKNFLYLPMYLRAVLMNNDRDRLMKYISQKNIVISKSGTGNSIFHDSGIVFKENEYIIVSVLTTSKQANHSKRFSDNIYIKTRNFFREIGKEIIHH